MFGKNTICTHNMQQLTMFLSPHSAVTRNLVDQYEQQRQHFMTGTTVNQFKKLFPASATPYTLSAEKVPVKLKLQSEWDSGTIDDLTKLVNLFCVAGDNLLVYKVQESCIIGEEPMWKYSQPKQGNDYICIPWYIMYNMW